jgi:transmembrane sensor
MVDKNEEAARWFAASRRGMMLHQERADYELWRCDPDNAARLAELHSIWRAMEQEPFAVGIFEPPAERRRVGHRGQLVAMVAFMSLTTTVLTQIDGGWWSTLDWWSR